MEEMSENNEWTGAGLWEPSARDTPCPADQLTTTNGDLEGEISLGPQTRIRRLGSELRPYRYAQGA